MLKSLIAILLLPQANLFILRLHTTISNYLLKKYTTQVGRNSIDLMLITCMLLLLTYKVVVIQISKHCKKIIVNYREYKGIS